MNYAGRPLKLSSPVTDIRGIGPAKAKVLAKLGINYARDFLYSFPRRHDDFSTITPIQDLKTGQTMTVHGRVGHVESKWGFQGRRRVLRIFVEIKDDTGVLLVIWYNLRFLPNQLIKNREIFVAGTVEETPSGKKGLPPATHHLQPRYRMRSPVIEFGDAGEHTHTGRITPVYSETAGVTSRFLRYNVKNLLPLIDALPEYLPPDIIERYSLIGIRQAIRDVHFPPNSAALSEARRRLRFDELFFLQLSALVRRRSRAQRLAYGVPLDPKREQGFFSSLPFTLTRAQQSSAEEIAADMAKTIPMNRLLQGDVGSGKSVVALFAAHNALSAGFSTLYLAPTEILARQQAQSFARFLGQDKVALLISALKTKEKEQIKARLASDEALCVIGTHALLQEDVFAFRCALAIVDEQHRFGVAQRQTLQEASRDGIFPHLLSMTATPIPRTLNLTVYGDLDVSVLNELPPGRQPIKTAIVLPDDRDKAIVHILEELHAGRQGYVISPLIDDSAKLELKSAKAAFKEMQHLFPDIAVGLLHGQMSSDEKAAVIRSFEAGALQLLVSTAVVEVGIDVPNATVMLIEGAERFGLAQLHQFRGRIGRGTHRSYCYLFPTAESAGDLNRLSVLARTANGFVIAEEDLKLRGPGEMYGVAQSGFGHLQVASLLDYESIKQARAEAERLLLKDSDLNSHPILQAKVRQKNLITHFE